MRLVQRQVEKRLSGMLGAEVTFEKLNLSLLGGSIDAQNVVVSAPGGGTPLLAIRRVRVEVSLAAALKKEIVVKSVTIEKPILSLFRGADGRLNLPSRLSVDLSDASGQMTDVVSDTVASPDAPKAWKFEAQKVLLVDGEAHFRDETGYHASAEKVLAEVKAVAGGFEFTLMADSWGRRDQPAEF